jgi:hypothetical protein
MANEILARNCFTHARLFYKRQPKSNNKVYQPPADQAKLMRRLQGVMAGNGMPRVRNLGYRAIAAGNHLRVTQNTFGNCTEMSCVAASFVAQLMPNEQLSICSLDPPGDHTFVVVGAPGNIHGNTIAQLQHTFDRNLLTYVIDIWCGIFCHVSDYYLEYLRKMDTWTRQSKFVMQPAPSGQPTPVRPLGLYAYRNINAVIRVSDPRIATI